MAYYQEYDYRIPAKFGIRIMLIGNIVSIAMIFLPENSFGFMSVIISMIGILLLILFNLLGVFIVIKSLQPTKKIVVTDTYIRFPKKPLSNDIITIYYDNITKFERGFMREYSTLEIKDKRQWGVLADIGFLDKENFEKIYDHIHWVNYTNKLGKELGLSEAQKSQLLNKLI